MWSVHLADRRKLTIALARPIALSMGDDLWKKISTDPLFIPVQIYYSAGRPDRPKQIQPDMYGVKWAFWDENIDRPLFPYLAEVRILEEKIYYFYADPKTQALLEPIIETFEEARKTDK